ncbi:hypothetical protein Tco_0703068 [Tanacetum coccineum]|uniref:Uncharacterized protein n=1 Tax=Tanacetum coccineum TaxID=301880 RepID=A0ABQ4XZN4_9ASTR
MVPTTPLRKSLMQNFIDRLFTEMHMTWSPDVTLVNVKEKSHKGMKCHKMPSKFVRSLMFGASILWDLETDIREKDEKSSQKGTKPSTKSKSVEKPNIEQFWSTAKAQTINEETQIHALVDGMKIVIVESSVRIDLQFADEDGTDCLPTTTIFEKLKLMGCLCPMKTAWNEFSSNIASAIICLATNQKFNFSKMVFDGMTRNLDSISAKFLMYPRIGKDFSGKVTPLFDTVLIQYQSEVGEGSGHPTNPQHTPTTDQPPISEPIIAQSSQQPIKTYKPRKLKKKVTQIPQSSEPIDLVADEAVLKEKGNSLERDATTTSSLEAEQVSGNITKTRSKEALNEPTPQETGSGSGPRRQDTMGDTIARTRFENVSKTSNDSPIGGVNTPQSDEVSMQLSELMEICTNLLQRVQDLETTKTAQAKEITSLKKRVKKLEQRGRSRTPRLKRFYKVGTSKRVESSAEASLGDQEDASKQVKNIAEIDADVDISLVHENAGIQGRFDDEDMFDTSVFNNEEVFAGQDMADQEVNVAKKEVSVADLITTAGEVVTTASVDISTTSVPITVSTATPTTPPTITTEDDMTLAETLMEIRVLNQRQNEWLCKSQVRFQE